MSDALLGVFLGGVIASVSPFITLWRDSARWKTERKLELLRERRARLEQLTEQVLPELSEAMVKRSYSSTLLSDIYVHAPKAVSDCFDEWVTADDKDEKAGKFAYMKICMAMKQAITDIDAEIAQTVDA